MKQNSTGIAYVLSGLLLVGLSPITTAQSGWEPITRPSKPQTSYREVIQRTAQMVNDSQAQGIARRLGLNILNITWEDTGRYKNSSVGPNISDMTIQVGMQNSRGGGYEVTSMPVIRFPNFSDVTCDLDPRDFTLLVGNEKGKSLKRVSLYELLQSPTRFLSNPRSWKSSKKTLLAARDSKVLVSAQACFLPIPQTGLATFNPVVFNYQSVQGDPAVLTILATREGTSMTIIDNQRDAFRSGSIWGQRLFHNVNGMRASLTGKRMSDFRIENPTNPNLPIDNNANSGMNMVLLIQVPLKQKTKPFRPYLGGAMPESAPSGGKEYQSKSRDGSDVESAVIGHGDLEGPFTEIDNLSIERDDRFPVRVTVQFYKATSNGVVSEADVRAIKNQIDAIYSLSDSVGSLVTGGRTGRVTEYDGSKVQPASWWEEFWRRYERDQGVNRYEAIQRLRSLLGSDYRSRPVCDLYLRDLLKTR